MGRESAVKRSRQTSSECRRRSEALWPLVEAEVVSISYSKQKWQGLNLCGGINQSAAMKLQIQSYTHYAEVELGLRKTFEPDSFC